MSCWQERQQKINDRGKKNRGRKRRVSQGSRKKVKAEWKADLNSKVNSVRGLECVSPARMTEGTLSIMQHSSFKRTERFHQRVQSNIVSGEGWGGGGTSSWHWQSWGGKSRNNRMLRFHTGRPQNKGQRDCCMNRPNVLCNYPHRTVWLTLWNSLSGLDLGSQPRPCGINIHNDM